MMGVPRAGFEPAVSWLKTRRPGPLDERGGGDDAHRREKSEGDGTRTRNLRIDSPALCQLSYTPISLPIDALRNVDRSTPCRIRTGDLPAQNRVSLAAGRTGR
jgi:hypothetical protein